MQAEDGNSSPKPMWEQKLEARDQKPERMIKRYENEIYPCVADQVRMVDVYKAYMSGTDLEDAALLFDVPFRTVKYWAEKAKWVQERTAIDMVEVEESNRRLMISRAQKVNKIVDRTVQVQEKIVDRVEKLVDSEGPMKAGELKAASEAAKNASDNSLRAVGIGESGATATQAAEEAKTKGGKTPLIVVFKSSDGLPPVRKAETVINVTEEVS